MAPSIVGPATGVPGTVVKVSATGLDPEQKYDLTTYDAAGTESGRAEPAWSSAQDRPDPNGEFSVGIRLPPVVGPCEIRCYQGGVIVARHKVTVATPAPTPDPVPAPDAAFGSRPSRGPLVVDGGSDIVITNIHVNGGSRDNVAGIGITVRNATNVTIRDVDMQNVVGAIYLYNCTGTLIIENVRSRNVGNGTIGAGHSNHIQLAECSFVGHISGCAFLGGWTEDMLSTWHTGGRGAGQELVIENNRLQGLVSDSAVARAWKSGSGTGIIISDGGGSPKNGWIIVRNNTLLTPGQVGIQHIDGPGLQVYGNVIYGQKRPNNNNPMTSWEGNPRGVVHDNRYNWTNNDGSQPSPWFGGGGSLVATNNTKDTSLNPDALRITELGG